MVKKVKKTKKGLKKKKALATAPTADDAGLSHDVFTTCINCGKPVPQNKANCPECGYNIESDEEYEEFEIITDSNEDMFAKTVTREIPEEGKAVIPTVQPGSMIDDDDGVFGARSGEIEKTPEPEPEPGPEEEEEVEEEMIEEVIYEEDEEMDVEPERPAPRVGLGPEESEKAIIRREEELAIKENKLKTGLDQLVERMKHLDEEIKEKIRLEFRIIRKEEELEKQAKKLLQWEEDLKKRLRRFSEYEEDLKRRAEDIMKKATDIEEAETRIRKGMISLDERHGALEEWDRKKRLAEEKLKRLTIELEKDREDLKAREAEHTRMQAVLESREAEIQRSFRSDLQIEAATRSQLMAKGKKMRAIEDEFERDEQALAMEERGLRDEESSFDVRKKELADIGKELDDIDVEPEQYQQGPVYAQAPQPEYQGGYQAQQVAPQQQLAAPPDDYNMIRRGPDGDEEIVEVTEELKPLKRIKCTSCGAVIPIYTDERPLQIECPGCSKRGVLK